LGYRHPQTGVAWSELAFIRLLNADDPGAGEAIRQAQSILKKSLGQAHPAYARTLIAQANLDALEGRPDDAVRETEKAIAIYRASYGDTHEFTLEAKFFLASRYWAEFSRTGNVDKRTEALELIGRTIDDSVRAHGGVPAIHRLAYGTLLANTGKSSEAADQLRIARKDAAEQYGAGSQESLHIRSTELSWMIDANKDAGEIDRAFAPLVADLEKLDTLYARAIAHSTWLERGRWLSGQGRRDEARQALLKAKEEAVKAKQPAWISVADLRLSELDSAPTAMK